MRTLPPQSGHLSLKKPMACHLSQNVLVDFAGCLFVPRELLPRRDLGSCSDWDA